MGNRTSLFYNRQSGGQFAVEDQGKSTGNRWFVDSGASNGADIEGKGLSPSSPFITIDYAVGQCTANNGDLIYAMPGHAETISGAAGIACDVEGISIIGQGEGDDRPTITFSATDSTMTVAADNIRIEKIVFLATAAIVNTIKVSKEYCTIRDCLFIGNAAAQSHRIPIITTTAGNDLIVDNVRIQLLVAEDGTTAITQVSSEAVRLVGSDRAIIKDCYFSGDFTTSAINGTGTASKDIQILNNRVNNIATEDIAGGIDLVAACTGFIDKNICYVDYATTNVAFIDAASCVLGRNWVSNEADEVPVLHGTLEAGSIEAKIDIIDGYHDVPASDTTNDNQMRDVIGKKNDAAVDTVGTNKSLMATLKGVLTDTGTTIPGTITTIDGYHDVPTSDTSDNAQMRDVVGKKSDAAQDTVANTRSLMGYTKAILTDTGTTIPGTITTIDGYHDVPASDTTNDNQMRDVIGKKDDAAVTAVTTNKSLMGYLKYLVNQTTVREVTGDADIDPSEADYTTYINLLTVTAPATGLLDCNIDIDFNKTSSGWDNIATAGDVLDLVVVKQVDGSNYRATQIASAQITANGNGTLDATESGFTVHVGPMQANSSVQFQVKMDTERSDCELPYRVTSVGAAPTVTAVAAT